MEVKGTKTSMNLNNKRTTEEEVGRADGCSLPFLLISQVPYMLKKVLPKCVPRFKNKVYTKFTR